jgi:outer membrane protein OmpA-like peptidoglycan-associated protein
MWETRASVAPAFVASPRTRCHCGGNVGPTGECDACRARRLRGDTEGGRAPQAVRGVLAEPGRPLESRVRESMEERFAHDFSGVRVHAGSRAAAAASEIGAAAFSAGNHVVLGQPRPGLGVLAHELAHVVQDGSRPASDRLGGADDPAERAAKTASRRVAAGLSAGPLAPAAPAIRRVLLVDEPGLAVGPGNPPNAQVFQNYLRALCPSGAAAVNTTSGRVSAPAACPAPPGAAGASRGTPASPGPAAMPQSCGCLCDLTSSSHIWTLRTSATAWPSTSAGDPQAATGRNPGGTGGTITVLPPVSPRTAARATTTGTFVNHQPWEVLAHELCGHARMMDVGRHTTDEQEAVEGRHVQTVPLENQIMAEHGLPLRGAITDPFCGESRVSGPGDQRSEHIARCRAFRDAYNREHGTDYRVQDAMPASAAPRYTAGPPLVAPPPLAASMSGGAVTVSEFPLGSAVLSHGHQVVLWEAAERIVGILRTDGESFITVDGHADEIGTDQRNDEVSRLRAEAVRDFLIASGVPADQIHAYGRGGRFRLPGTPRVSPANRRVEVTTTRRRRRDLPSILSGGLQPPGTPPSPAAPRVDPGLVLPRFVPLDRPETPEETGRRIFRPIPPPSRGTSRSATDALHDVADSITGPLTRGLPEPARNLIRDAARAALERGALAPVDAVLSSTSLGTDERRAIRSAVEAAMRTRRGESSPPR